MTKIEATLWIDNKLNLCYTTDKCDNYIDWIYDENFIRKSKLCKINNKKIKYPTQHNGTCLFEQHTKRKKFYCDYDEIWEFLEINYTDNYKEIQSTIKSVMKNYKKLNKYTPHFRFFISSQINN